jgi:hypothetical protein
MDVVALSIRSVTVLRTGARASWVSDSTPFSARAAEERVSLAITLAQTRSILTKVGQGRRHVSLKLLEDRRHLISGSPSNNLIAEADRYRCCNDRERKASNGGDLSEEHDISGDSGGCGRW